MRPARRHHSEQSIDCGAANPRLYSKPTTSHDCAQDCRNICTLRSECSAAKNREGNSILSACVRIEDHGYEHDAVAQKNRDHRLPPVHPGFDEPAGKRVSSYDHAHADPEGCDVPG